jgi:catechol 2,3-dioxygenase-like lactoylglutathione lyase family enzyme
MGSSVHERRLPGSEGGVRRAPLASEGGIGVKISFVAGFGPIIREADAAQAFWRDGLGIEFEEAAPGYFTNYDLDGVKAFAMWPLSQAAEATFGRAEWPVDVPTPQAWIELDVESAEAVGAAVAEMQAGGHRLLREGHEEPWGQTTSRLLSPEGLLVGITFTPWMHERTADPITES